MPSSGEEPAEDLLVRLDLRVRLHLSHRTTRGDALAKAKSVVCTPTAGREDKSHMELGSMGASLTDGSVFAASAPLLAKVDATYRLLADVFSSTALLGALAQHGLAYPMGPGFSEGSTSTGTASSARREVGRPPARPAAAR